MSRLIDKTGHRFGRLVVVSQAPSRQRSNGRGGARWHCLCDCGRTSIVASEKLGKTTFSCGCLHAEMTGLIRRTHGQSIGVNRNPAYLSWKAAKGRCYNPNNPKYPRYGARGITMAPEWRDSFERFLADMGPRPKGMSIERIDNDGPYAPGNCRWATKMEQQSNKSSNVFAVYHGERITLSELARRMGVSTRRLHKAFRKKQGDPVLIAEQLRDH